MQAESLTSKETGCMYMFTEKKIDQLTMMYKVFYRTPSTLNHIINKMNPYIMQEGEKIVKNDENSLGQRALHVVDCVATGLFAAVGVIIAGQAGMNVVGATLVGCAACLGGGTLNDVMTGKTVRPRAAAACHR